MSFPPDGWLPNGEQVEAPVDPPVDEPYEAAVDDALTVPGPGRAETKPVQYQAPDTAPAGAPQTGPIGDEDCSPVFDEGPGPSQIERPQPESTVGVYAAGAIHAQYVRIPPETEETERDEPPAEATEAVPEQVMTNDRADEPTSPPEVTLRFERCSTVLGSQAVEAATEAAEAAAEGREEELPTREREVTRQVAEARTKLEDLRDQAERTHATKRMAREVDRALEVDKWPDSLQNMLDAHEPKEGWGENKTTLAKLTATDKDGNPVVSDGMLLNVLQWHGARHDVAEKVFQEQVLPERIASFVSCVKEGVANETLPPLAAARLPEVLKNTTVVLDDGFDTLVKGMVGHYSPTEDKISLYRTSRIVVNHEGFHTLESRRDWDDNVLLPKNPPLHGIFWGSYVGGALVEGVVEHYSVASAHPEVNLYDTAALLGEHSYQEGRLFMDTICRFGRHPVDVRRFMAVALEDDRTRAQLGPDSAHAHLLRAIQRAFPGGEYLRLKQATGNIKGPRAGEIMVQTANMYRQPRGLFSRRKPFAEAREGDLTFGDER